MINKIIKKSKAQGIYCANIDFFLQQMKKE